ncbi:MAG: O-methyltransferase [bacterium]
MIRNVNALIDDIFADPQWQLIRKEAISREFPVMQAEGLRLLLTTAIAAAPTRILEIGTGTGCSAIALALATNADVWTIERDPQVIGLARENIAASRASGRIVLVQADALAFDETMLGTFGLVFLDAAKGQYLKLFHRYARCLEPGGTIVIDNLDFHGNVAAADTTLSRSLREMTAKIRSFREWFLRNKAFDAQIHPVGDGIGIGVRKRDDLP